MSSFKSFSAILDFLLSATSSVDELVPTPPKITTFPTLLHSSEPLLMPPSQEVLGLNQVNLWVFPPKPYTCLYKLWCPNNSKKSYFRKQLYFNVKNVTELFGKWMVRTNARKTYWFNWFQSYRRTSCFATSHGGLRLEGIIAPFHPLPPQKMSLDQPILCTFFYQFPKPIEKLVIWW